MIPEVGFVRLPQIIGQTEVTERQAAENRRKGKGPKRARSATIGVVPYGRSTWWAGVKAGRFPAPVRLGPRTVAWKAEDIRTLVDRLGKAAS